MESKHIQSNSNNNPPSSNNNQNNNAQSANQTKEKEFTIQSFMSKLKNSEPTTFGNYYVNFNDMFPKEDDYVDYLKNHVSLFNDDLVNKPKYEGEMKSFLQPSFFTKFKDETLLYIFYFMPRDTLQLYAAEQLDKNGWKYHPVHQIWFQKEKGTDKLTYFNPIEWKKCDYIFGQIDDKDFLEEEEIKKYSKQLENDNHKKEKKTKGNNKSQNSNFNENLGK